MRVKQLLGSLLLAGLLSQMGSTWADVLHLQNGKVIRGKVERLVGELIEYQSNGLGINPAGGNQGTITRMELSNRHDVVEIRNRQKLFGQIIYIDPYKIEIQTGKGLLQVKRRRVSNIVLGTPNQQPVNDLLENTSQQFTQLNPKKPAATMPADFNPADMGSMFPTNDEIEP